MTVTVNELMNRGSLQQSLCLFQPEWYFTQVLSWIRDHMDFMETRIQPLLIEAGKSSIDAKVCLITYNDTCSKISNTYLFLGGSVVECLTQDCGAGGSSRHCVVSLSKNINPSLVLVQPWKSHPFITEILLMGRKEPNQTNKTYLFLF